MPIANAKLPSREVLGGDCKISLKAIPIKTGETAAMAALPRAPIKATMPSGHWRTACEATQRAGPRRSVGYF